MAIKVQIRDHEPIEKALRRLKRLCTTAGVSKDLKQKAHYEKPSERRRRKEKERRKTIRLADLARAST